MNATTKKLLIALAVVSGAAVLYVVWKKVTATKAEFDAMVAKAVGLALTPLNAAIRAANTVAGNVSAAASIPGLVSQSQQLDDELAAMNENDYAPGGRIYNKILNEKGKAAADKAWADVQAHLTAQRNETASWWKFW